MTTYTTFAGTSYGEIVSIQGGDARATNSLAEKAADELAQKAFDDLAVSANPYPYIQSGGLQHENGLCSALKILERVYDIPGRWATGSKNQTSTALEDNLPEEGELSPKQEEKQSGTSEEAKKSGLVADRVSEALFRRMRHFLGRGKDIMPSDHMIEELYNALSLLLYYLSEEDRYLKIVILFLLGWPRYSHGVVKIVPK